VILGFLKTKARFVCLRIGEGKGPGEKDKEGLSSSSATTKVSESGFTVLQAGVLFLSFYWL